MNPAGFETLILGAKGVTQDDEDPGKEKTQPPDESVVSLKDAMLAIRARKFKIVSFPTYL